MWILDSCIVLSKKLKWHGHYFGQKLFFRLKCPIKTFLILNQNCTCGKERQTLNATIYITSPRPPESQTGRELMTAPKELVNTTGFINHSFALKKNWFCFFFKPPVNSSIYLFYRRNTLLFELQSTDAWS